MTAATELAARVKRRVRAQIVRTRHRLGLPALDPGPVRLAKQFRHPIAVADQTALTVKYRERFAAAADLEIASAERLLRHEFNLLGHEMRFGPTIAWSRDPVSGRDWSREFSPDIPYRGPRRLGDIKLPWELNKHQYFFTLGKAGWLTGDPRYAREIVAQIDHWIADNPCQRGIHWVSALETGTRALSWILAWPFFAHVCEPALVEKMLHSLGQHLLFVERNLSFDRFPNTHLAGEVAILVAGGLFLDCRHSQRWWTTGLRHLETQILEQVRLDGVHAEQSVAYHRFFLDHYYLVNALLVANGRAFSAQTLAHLERMTQFVMDVMLPDGSVPTFGDADDARGAWFHSQAPRDYRALLALGALNFRRPDFKQIAAGPSEELLWLHGTRGLEEFDLQSSRTPDHTSTAYEQAGYYIMRAGWETDACVATFDCGPLGHGPAGHGHADALSLQLYARNYGFLVDPGTYSYNLDYAHRHSLRSTRAHNTLTVGGQDQSVQRDRMSWETAAAARCLRWTSTPDFDLVEAEHDGYRRLTPPVTHRRVVVYVKPDVWIVYDRVLDSPAGHPIEWFLHLRPDCRIADSPHSVRERLLTSPSGAQLRLFWSVPDAAATDGTGVLCETLEEMYSETYGKLARAPALRITRTDQRAAGAWTLLSCLTTSTNMTLQTMSAPEALRVQVTRPGRPDFHLTLPHTLEP